MALQRRKFLGVLGIAALSGAAAPVLADSDWGGDDDRTRGKKKGKRKDDEREREALRAAVAAGELLPLAEVLNRVQPSVKGDIIGIEAEFERGVWLYEIKVIEPAGRLIEYYVDPRTAEIVKIEEKLKK